MRTWRLRKWGVLLVFGVSLVVSAFAGACHQPPRGTNHILESCESSNLSFFKGPPDIWPWGSETTFPWSEVTGVWRAGGKNPSDIYYLFKVLRQTISERELEITAYDPETCSVLGRGKGVQQGRVVSALMISTDGNSYLMSIHAFDGGDLRKQAGAGRYIVSYPDGNVVMVMRIDPLCGKESKTTDFEIQRINSNPTPICE